jgi:ABC-type uncharacterized transport system permease subunit
VVQHHETTARARVRDIVILSCVVSAGIHSALVPEHFDEGTGPRLGFVLATAVLAALAVVLTRRATPFGYAANALGRDHQGVPGALPLITPTHRGARPR